MLSSFENFEREKRPKGKKKLDLESNVILVFICVS